ncbi:hypothetical protein BC832DRAFT_547839 [Gaertneriomyces semiglobifer]|nr:hypothetical protein BC832DRAFT_547839 [Gaertneriomyces semiglobifer]
MFIAITILFCLWIATAGIAIAAIANTGLLKSGEALGEGVVTSTKLASHAVASINLSPNAVGTEHISASAVTGPKIAVDSVDSTHILDNAVTEQKIADNAVTGSKIGSGAVTGLKIAIGSVDTTHIADGAVTNAKIGNEAVTTAKIGPSAVNEGKILNGAVTEDKILNGAVTTAKIDDGAVTAYKILNGAVTEYKIADDAVTEGKILNGAVTNDKIVDGAITPEKMSADPTADWPTWIQSKSNASPNRVQVAGWTLDNSGSVPSCLVVPQAGEVLLSSCTVVSPGHYGFEASLDFMYLANGIRKEVLVTPRSDGPAAGHPVVCATETSGLLAPPGTAFVIRCFDVVTGMPADADGSFMLMYNNVV